jgi:hypothetical protein
MTTGPMPSLHCLGDGAVNFYSCGRVTTSPRWARACPWTQAWCSQDTGRPVRRRYQRSPPAGSASRNLLENRFKSAALKAINGITGGTLRKVAKHASVRTDVF